MTGLLSAEVEQISGQAVALCYHCRKCTAGCPVVSAMDYGPDHVLGLVLLDQRTHVLTSRDIWLCVGCYTCAARCPNGIDLVAVMDTLRQIAIRDGYTAGEPDVALFHRLFLEVVKRLGRSHEAVVLGLYKVLSRTPRLQDLGAGLGLVMRGKVPLLPARSGSGPAIRRLLQRSR